MGEAHHQRTCIGTDIPSSQYRYLSAIIIVIEISLNKLMHYCHSY